jgi:hypothetical protein
MRLSAVPQIGHNPESSVIIFFIFHLPICQFISRCFLYKPADDQRKNQQSSNAFFFFYLPLQLHVLWVRAPELGVFTSPIYKTFHYFQTIPLIETKRNLFFFFSPLIPKQPPAFNHNFFRPWLFRQRFSSVCRRLPIL